VLCHNVTCVLDPIRNVCGQSDSFAGSYHSEKSRSLADRDERRPVCRMSFVRLATVDHRKHGTVYRLGAADGLDFRDLADCGGDKELRSQANDFPVGNEEQPGVSVEEGSGEVGEHVGAAAVLGCGRSGMA